MLIRKKILLSIYTCIILIIASLGYYYYPFILDKFINYNCFYIKKVIVIGASPRVEKLIKENLGTKVGQSIFTLSTTKLSNNLRKIGWIKQFNIQKILPNIIKITINERQPVALYAHDGKYTIIDKEGYFLEDVKHNPQLILISGKNANSAFINIYDELNKYPKLKLNIKNFDYISNRRWNIILNNNLIIKLPDTNIPNVFPILNKLLKNSKVKNQVTCIDLRIPNNVYLCGLVKK